MKRFAILAAALALSALACGDSFAQSGFKIVTLPRLKFIIGAGTAPKDTVSMTGMSTSTTVASVQDTTAWFDVGSYRFAQGAASMPMISAALQTTVAADSIGYQIQWASDDNDATKFGSWSSQAYAVGGLSNVVSIAQSSAEIGRKFRIILHAYDATGVVHTYSIVPIVRVAQ